MINVDDLPLVAKTQICNALTIPNEEREKALSLKQFGAWDLPEFLPLWREETHRSGAHMLYLPRGFAAQLVAGLSGLGIEIAWDDQRTTVRAAEGYYRPFLMRDYQAQAAAALISAQQGFYKAPAGCVSGDTELRFNRAGKGFKRDISDAYRRFHGLSPKSWDRSIPTYCRTLVDGIYHQHLVEDIVCSGPKPTIELELESGKKLVCTREHGVLTKQGWCAAGNLDIGSMVTVNGEPVLIENCIDCGDQMPPSKQRPTFPSSYKLKHPGVCGSCRGRRATQGITIQIIKDKDGYLQEIAPGHPRASSHNRVPQHILVAEAMIGRSIGIDDHVHHKNMRKDDNWPDNLEVVTPAEHHRIHRGFLKMDGGTGGRGGKIVFIPKYERVIAIRDAGVQQTYDMVMQDPHNNFVANGIVVHNSGKTVTILGALAIIGQKAMIITDKANLLEQWRTRAAQFYGMPLIYDDDGKPSAALEGDRCPGKIGQDVWEERDLTIALRQTLHSRGWSLDATKWWQTWGVTVFDEGHHLAAETTGDVSRSSTSFYLWGTSATPAGSQAKAQIVHSLVGPIVHETSRPELYERKVLMRPIVEVIDGELDCEFWPDHDAEFDKATKRWKCQKPGCGNGGRKHLHRNNYASVLKSLVESPERNSAIAEYIIARRGRYHLVPSRQKKHLDLLKKAVVKAGWPEEKIWMLRGEENAEGLSQQIADEVMASDEAVIFSTVADEGLDIPPLDHIHMVFPIRKDLPVIQLVGRVERIHPGKESAVIIDWREPGVSVFAEQFNDRSAIYRMQTYEVIYINKEESA